MTYKEIINQVLIRLREDIIVDDWTGPLSTSSSVTPYQKLIGSLVNDSKEGTELYHDWNALRDTFTVTTAPGTMQYTLGDYQKGAGLNFKILDVINQDTGNELVQANNKWLNSRVFPEVASGIPTHYALNGSSSVVAHRGLDANLDLYPVPNSEYKINFNIIKTQDTLEYADTVIKVPAQVVMLGAWARAIAERGEDGGTISSAVAAEGREALTLSIQLDAGNTEYERDWYIN